MKEVKAVIQPHKLARLRAALFQLPGFNGMTVSRVEGMSRPGGPGDGPRTLKEELTDYSGKTLITIVADDETAGPIAALIGEVATTGQKGDGLVWIVPVEGVLRVRDAKPAA